MRDPQFYIDAVCDYFGVKQETLLSDNRTRPLPMARKILIYLLRDRTHVAISRVVGRDASMVGVYITELNSLGPGHEIFAHLEAIQKEIQTEMTIKLNQSQLGSLHDIFEHFLSMKPDSVTLELISLLIEEIKEKCRKRTRSGKENLSLDEKQLRAFLIWYHHFGGMYKENHPYAHMTLLDMISQIKPIAHAQRITLTT